MSPPADRRLFIPKAALWAGLITALFILSLGLAHIPAPLTAKVVVTIDWDKMPEAFGDENGKKQQEQWKTQFLHDVTSRWSDAKLRLVVVSAYENIPPSAIHQDVDTAASRLRTTLHVSATQVGETQTKLTFTVGGSEKTITALLLIEAVSEVQQELKNQTLATGATTAIKSYLAASELKEQEDVVRRELARLLNSENLTPDDQARILQLREQRDQLEFQQVMPALGILRNTGMALIGPNWTVSQTLTVTERSLKKHLSIVTVTALFLATLVVLMVTLGVKLTQLSKTSSRPPALPSRTDEPPPLPPQA